MFGGWSHPAFDQFKAGFARHALSYMMSLRLAGMPFNVVNVAPALIGVPYSTFIIGTLAGLLPSRIALSTAGAGLGQAINSENSQYWQCVTAHDGIEDACAYNIHLASLLTRETIAAFVALAVLALSPAILDGASRVWRWITSARGAGR